MQGAAETAFTEAGSILPGETVEEGVPIPGAGRGDSTRAALDCVHRLLVRTAPEQPALTSLLTELALAFDADAAGLAGLPECVEQLRFAARPCAEQAPEPDLPWRKDPTLLSRGHQVPGAVSLHSEGCALLATTLAAPEGSGWVLWLEDRSRSEWTDGEAGALVLAGHALSRWLTEGQARWVEQLDRVARQQQLETAATVTRRLAHDFGNVLTGILGFTELALAQQTPANTPLHTYISEVYRAAQGGAQLTHQLRLFSRRQSSSSRSSPLMAVLADQEARLFSLREAGVHLRLNVQDDLPAVALDGEHLAQVLSALLENAREALVGPGSISVSARSVELTASGCRELYGALRPGPHVEVTIADTGVGLNPEAQKRLFSEPFFTTKPRRRGFGLAISYGILHAHRGGVRLYPGEDHGVVARILLPAVGPYPAGAGAKEAVRAAQRPLRAAEPSSVQNSLAGASDPARRKPSARASGCAAAPLETSDAARRKPSADASGCAAAPDGERILAVDDEPEVLQVVTSSLERAGYRVDGAVGGEAALEGYFNHGGDPYRLVVTDVVMPGVSGVDLAHRLRQRDPAVRLLFISAHVSSDFTLHDFAKDGFELLPKPFRADHLLRAVRSAIDRPARKK